MSRGGRVAVVPSGWPELSHDAWRETCDTLHGCTLAPSAARWDSALGGYILERDDARTAEDPHAAAVQFAHAAFTHGCVVCEWDSSLHASAEGQPPPVR